MSGLPVDQDAGGGRFPGFEVMAQSKHWDPVTRAVVASRVSMPPDIRFFSATEEATAGALCDQLLGQREPPRIPVVNMIDARLAEKQTDGWHYEAMGPDGESWRESLAHLDADARLRGGASFAECTWDEQTAILQSIQDMGSHPWHGIPADRAWSLWTRYACTAFYSHPWAWAEIGFAGPAYPRGYKNMGVNRREHFEVRDARPGQDPLRKDTP